MKIRPRFGAVAVVALLAVVISGVLAGLASSASSGSTAATVDHKTTVVIDIDSGKPNDPKNFNPYSPNTTNDGGLSQAIYEPLFIPNLNTGKQIPWLATGMVSAAGGKVWVLNLRKGVRWSDGKPFTADDVVFTIQMIQKYPDLNTPNKYKGVVAKKINATSVRFTLPTPDPRFQLAGFSSVLPSKELFIVPKHVFASQSDPVKFTNYNPGKGWPVGTGAYKLTSAGTTTFSYTRDPKWWGAATGFRRLPAAKQLLYTALGPIDTRAAALAKNDLDVGASFTIGTLQALAAQNKKVQAWSTSPPYGYLDVCSRSLDFQTENPTWSNPQLRWAVNYALNRKSIINVAFQGASLGSTTMLPAYPGFAPYFKLLAKSGVYKTYPISTSSPALAKQKIEAQGYSLQGGTYKKGGKSLSLEVTTFNDPTMVSIASTIVEELKAVGIDASVRSLAIPNFIDSLLAGKFEANVFFGACGSTVDPWQSMDAFNVSHYAAPGQTSAGFYANTFRWNTPTAKSYSATVNQIGKLVPGDPKINPLFVRAMNQYYSELPSIPLVQNPLINPTNSTYWTNWPTKTNPYISTDFAGPIGMYVLHNIKPAN